MEGLEWLKTVTLPKRNKTKLKDQMNTEEQKENQMLEIPDHKPE
ncbi:hypothetical protein [Oceanobacillus senegalensis]|nr:hypothetical protein [Oceanobacillus senegalensis]